MEIIVFFVLMVGATLLGHFLCTLDERHMGRTGGNRVAEAQAGYLVAAVTGLLALLLGFTYSLAIQRFEERRQLVMDEANAIAATWFKAQVLEEPHRTELSTLLAEYVDHRISIAEAHAGRRDVRAMWEADLLFQARLVKETVEAVPTAANADITTSLVEAVAVLLQVNASRVQSRLVRVPTIVFGLLVVYELIAMVVLGYTLHGPHGAATSAILLLLFGVSLALIYDIDRPTVGTIRESQSPMIHLRATMDAGASARQ